MSELTLDDVQRDALPGHLDRVRELVRPKAAPDSGDHCEVARRFSGRPAETIADRRLGRE